MIAENLARIFRQNINNCGMTAIELSKDQIESLFKKYSGKDSPLGTDVEKKSITFKSDGKSETI